MTRGSLLMHRAVLGAARGQIVDHINGNRLDNRKSNLRFVNFLQNRQWRPGCKSVGECGFVGVRLRAKNRNGSRGKNPYFSIVFHNGEHFYLGMFPTAEAAAMAYDRKAKELFGEFATLNFPDHT